MASLIAVAPSWGAETEAREPLKTPQGVRTAARMYASWISFLRAGLEESWRRRADRRWVGIEGRAVLRALVRIAWEAIAAAVGRCVEWLETDEVLLRRKNNQHGG